MSFCIANDEINIKRPASVVIDFATYLLTISSPDIDNVTMSLYDINEINHMLCHLQWQRIVGNPFCISMHVRN